MSKTPFVQYFRFKLLDFNDKQSFETAVYECRLNECAKVVGAPMNIQRRRHKRPQRTSEYNFDSTFEPMTSAPGTKRRGPARRTRRDLARHRTPRGAGRSGEKIRESPGMTASLGRIKTSFRKLTAARWGPIFALSINYCLLFAI